MMRRVGLATALVLLAAAVAGAQPANDDCANATVIGQIPFHHVVDVSGATQEAGDPGFECEASPSVQRAKTVWYRYTASSAINLEVTTLGSDYDTIVGAFRGTCGALSLAFCNERDPDDNRVFGDDSSMLMTLNAGETIYLAAADLDDSPSATSLTFDVATTPIFVASDFDGTYYPMGAVAAGTSGDFLVVWTSNDPVIRGQLFDRRGRSKGPPFDIGTPQYSYFADVAAAGDGSYVVVWGDYPSGPDRVMARRVDASGTPLAAPFQVNVGSVDEPAYPAVAADGIGDFVVAWTGASSVAVQRIDTSDTGLVADLAVGGPGRWPAVSMAPDGRFVVAWTDQTGLDGDGYGVAARRYDATAAPLGSAFVVNTYTTSYQGDLGPDVAMTDDGDFVVVWASGYNQNPDIAKTVQGRLFGSTGAAVTGEFQVNTGAVTYGYYGQSYGNDKNDGPSVAADGSDAFVVAWHRQDSGPYGRRVDASGTPTGDEFQIGTFWDDYQAYYRTDVAATADGSFMVVWDQTTFNEPTQTLGRGFPASGCPAVPASGCKQPLVDLKGKLKVKQKIGDPSKSVLAWTWVSGEAVAPAELGDPVSADGYQLCVWDGSGTVVSEAVLEPGELCAGKPCWKATSVGFVYKDKTSASGGVKKLLVKAGDAGQTKVVAKAKGTELEVPPLPLVLPATMQLHADTGACWTATFDVAGMQRNTATSFGGQAQTTP